MCSGQNARCVAPTSTYDDGSVVQPGRLLLVFMFKVSIPNFGTLSVTNSTYTVCFTSGHGWVLEYSCTSVWVATAGRRTVSQYAPHIDTCAVQGASLRCPNAAHPRQATAAEFVISGRFLAKAYLHIPKQRTSAATASSTRLVGPAINEVSHVLYSPVPHICRCHAPCWRVLCSKQCIEGCTHVLACVTQDLIHHDTFFVSLSRNHPLSTRNMTIAAVHLCLVRQAVPYSAFVHQNSQSVRLLLLHHVHLLRRTSYNSIIQHPAAAGSRVLV